MSTKQSKPSRSWLRGRLLAPRDERGSILVMAAGTLVLAVIAAGLSVDVGGLGVEARKNQRVADLAALDAARELEDPNPFDRDPTTAARQSAARNGFDYLAPGNTLTVEWAPSLAGVFTSAPGILIAGAASVVRVRVSSTFKNAFPFLPDDHVVTRESLAAMGSDAPPTTTPTTTTTIPPTSTTAAPTTTVPVAAVDPLGTVRVGSTLASANSADSAILNGLLTSTVGGSYSLGAVGWQGLASGNFTFSQLRTALGLSAGTVNSVLDTNITFRRLLDATASALNANGQSAASANVVGIASQIAASTGASFTLRSLFDVYGNVGNGADVADVSLNAKDMVVGGLALADADHFASMNLTAAQIPGLPGTSVKVNFGLIEAPQTKSGAPKDAGGIYRTVAETAQLRFQLLVTLPVSVTIPLVGTIGLTVTVPYYLEAGSARAALDTMTCTGPDTPTNMKIMASTNAGRTFVGYVDDAALGNPTSPTPGSFELVNVSILGLGNVRTTLNGTLQTTITGNPGELLTFTPPYSGTTSQQITGSAVSLHTLAGANLNTTALVGGTLISDTIAQTVNLLLPDLSSALLQPLYRATGLSFANADIWAPPAQHCNPTSYTISGPSPTTTVAPGPTTTLPPATTTTSTTTTTTIKVPKLIG